MGGEREKHGVGAKMGTNGESQTKGTKPTKVQLVLQRNPAHYEQEQFKFKQKRGTWGILPTQMRPSNLCN